MRGPPVVDYGKGIEVLRPEIFGPILGRDVHAPHQHGARRVNLRPGVLRCRPRHSLYPFRARGGNDFDSSHSTTRAGCVKYVIAVEKLRLPACKGNWLIEC